MNTRTTKRRDEKTLLDIVGELPPEAQRDILDVAVYLIWCQTGKPAPWKNVIRGGKLFIIYKMQNFGIRMS